MTALFFFSCSYFSPWFFYISLFNWLEENKAEKQKPKVNIWNAVAWKDLFLVFYEVAKGFMSWYGERDEYMHCWLKEEFCLRSKSSLCFTDQSAECVCCDHPSSLGNKVPVPWDCRACGRAAPVQPAVGTGTSHDYSGAGASPSRGFSLLHSVLAPFKDDFFLRHIQKAQTRSL